MLFEKIKSPVDTKVKYCCHLIEINYAINLMSVYVQWQFKFLFFTSPFQLLMTFSYDFFLCLQLNLLLIYRQIIFFKLLNLAMRKCFEESLLSSWFFVDNGMGAYSIFGKSSLLMS